MAPLLLARDLAAGWAMIPSKRLLAAQTKIKASRRLRLDLTAHGQSRGGIRNSPERRANRQVRSVDLAAATTNPPEAEFRAGSLRSKHVALFKGAASEFYHRILRRSTNKISAGCDLRGNPI
jgi:hypothetical protein